MGNGVLRTSPGGKGFFVLQVRELTDAQAGDLHIWNTLNEATVAMAVYESAIDNLDRKGLIDRNRVGITGFSRSFWYVTYTLTHSRHRFAAAALADGVDFGYFQYMTLTPWFFLTTFEAINGAPPFGKGLRTWLKRSSAFLMDRIETPIRIQTLYPESLFSDWHWYLGLSPLAKPVEMIYIPGGTHILEKPWERMTSQQGNVDWFCFWLKAKKIRTKQKPSNISAGASCVIFMRKARLGGSKLTSHSRISCAESC
jgi:hypothetical protein